MKKTALALAALMLLTVVAVAAEILMHPVESSLIAKAGYDAETQTLALQLVNSSDVYNYQGVPQDIYDGFLAAESKGSYYVSTIKAKYPALKSE